LKKSEFLKANGTYNKRHGLVKKSEFLLDDFYDPIDVVQVKYEMLRDTKESGKSIGAVAQEFGFSRTAYYNSKEGFEKNGMSALLPEKTGPKHPHKLKGPILEFVNEYTATRPNASAAQVVSAIKTEKDVVISKRTIERYAEKKKPV
jgi:transposase